MKLICAPNDMVLWLKFDSANPAVNSSGTTKTLYCVGQPKKLPPGFGIFRNWGAYFSGKDCIRIASGVNMSELPNNATITHSEVNSHYVLKHDWTISFWLILPIDKSKDGSKKVLI